MWENAGKNAGLQAERRAGILRLGLREQSDGSVAVFETCPMCSEVWVDREVFLSDPQVEVVGYQANLEDLESGLFFFNHTRAGCGTTLSIEARQFVDLAPGPICREHLEGTELCPEYCLRQDELRTCPLPCECAYVRDVLQIVRNSKKQPAV